MEAVTAGCVYSGSWQFFNFSYITPVNNLVDSTRDVRQAAFYSSSMRTLEVIKLPSVQPVSYAFNPEAACSRTFYSQNQ